jgi:hypothetical protein
MPSSLYRDAASLRGPPRRRTQRGPAVRADAVCIEACRTIAAFVADVATGCAGSGSAMYSAALGAVTTFTVRRMSLMSSDSRVFWSFTSSTPATWVSWSTHGVNPKAPGEDTISGDAGSIHWPRP